MQCCLRSTNGFNFLTGLTDTPTQPWQINSTSCRQSNVTQQIHVHSTQRSRLSICPPLHMHDSRHGRDVTPCKRFPCRLGSIFAGLRFTANVRMVHSYISLSRRALRSYKKFREIDLENFESSSCDFCTSSSYICQKVKHFDGLVSVFEGRPHLNPIYSSHHIEKRCCKFHVLDSICNIDTKVM